MSRHLEPNASHYSARYAERKNQARKARDAAIDRSKEPCLVCPTPQHPGRLLCAKHLDAYKVACDVAVATGAPSPELRRTYWPEVTR